VDDAGNCLPDGTPGELTITPLGVEGMPLVRFRTGDIARKLPGTCSCGWTTERIGPVEGRTAQRMKMRGTTLYPEAIFHILQEIPEVANWYIEVYGNYDLSDHVKVYAGCRTDGCGREIEALLQARLRVRPEVVVTDPDTVTREIFAHGGRKPKLFIDLRKSS
jgi:phenylacetate-CoA ligase